LHVSNPPPLLMNVEIRECGNTRKLLLDKLNHVLGLTQDQASILMLPLNFLHS